MATILVNMVQHVQAERNATRQLTAIIRNTIKPPTIKDKHEDALDKVDLGSN